MWGAITKYFSHSEDTTKVQERLDNLEPTSDSFVADSSSKAAVNETAVQLESPRKMDSRQKQQHSSDADNLEVKQARRRASVKWILSKAFNNRVPDNLKEPFYRDHEGQEHLKPQIVVEMGNASLYCQTLSNLYSDPNYQNLNHGSILQTLARKGVPVAESPEQPLTETVLIQTNPLRINAHMSVIEALMILYAKEVASGDRITTTITRISGSVLTKDSANFESALLAWVAHVCAALKRRIDQDIERGATDENGARLQSPNIPLIKDYQDLCDGICLDYLISYYCPKLLPWTSVRVNYLPTVEDSIHNVLLVSNFSQRHLPYSVFHMTPEDITYMRGSMKNNLIVLLADLFNLFEIHPAKCVCYPGMDMSQSTEHGSIANEHGIVHRRGLTSQPVAPIPDLRSGLESPIVSPTSSKPPFQVIRSPSAQFRKQTPPREESVMSAAPEEGFVVHKSRGITTLSSMQEPLVPARLRQAKEKSNVDSKADERGDSLPAGRPSNWEETRKSSFSGRRSRRNSFSEDSQLTIENFGGSQDQINFIGRSGTLERERKISNVSLPNNPEPAVAVRSSVADNRGTFQIGYDTDSGSEKQDRDTEKSRNANSSHTKEEIEVDTTIKHLHDIDHVHTQVFNMDQTPVPPKRKTSFTMPSNTTTWQAQSAHYQQMHHLDDHGSDDEDKDLGDVSRLMSVRMKLEAKRRQIELERRKEEIDMQRKSQKLNKQAFLQAITKGKTQTNSEDVKLNERDPNSMSSDKSDRPCSLQDINDISMESKYSTPSDSKQTPDSDQMDLEQYQERIAHLDSKMQTINNDIQKIVSKENQFQAMQIQAQQLMQAQQIANMLSQQQPSYGSQQHIPRSMHQQGYTSTPHIPPQQPQPIYNPSNNYPMRPPSRDPFLPPGQNMNFINEQGQYVQQPNYMPPNQQYSDPYNRMGQPQPYQNNYMEHPNQMYSQPQYQQPMHDDYRSPPPPQQQFYLHDNPVASPPQPAQRRTWSQSVNNSMQPQLDVNAWQQNAPQQIDTRTWKSPNQSSGNGFVLHQQQNGNRMDDHASAYSSHSSSPQHNRVHRQISQIMSSGGNDQTDFRDNRMPMSPPIDDMAPQSISFVEDDDTVPQYGNRRDRNNYDADINLSKLNITSGNRTYRIPSPTRPGLNMNSFQDPQEDANNGKGFYISFDDEQPKRPKPPLRTKRSPKKEQNSMDQQSTKTDIRSPSLKDSVEPKRTPVVVHHVNTNENNRMSLGSGDAKLNNGQDYFQSLQQSNIDRKHLEDVTNYPVVNAINNSQSMNNYSPEIKPREQKPIIIGNEESNLDRDTLDEMERKKEKMMLQSLQRKQQMEEAKARKEIEAMQRKEKEREKEDERARKREEQAARRAQILEQHKLKKAVEEAEREGKPLDRHIEMMLKQQQQQQLQSQQVAAPKMRSQRVVRPRPKTIHVESGSVDLSDVSSLTSRSKKGSNSNLTGIGQLSSNSMRRDYYRGSQDSLAIRESPDEYPSTSSTPIGRRGSYKTTISRDHPPPVMERGRTMSRIHVAKGSTAGMTFRGRKSNSLMNLCDTDSGLGRATPPRRAASPGMGTLSRHLPSPSGPGSLPPGLMTKRRMFDDGSSDMSTTSSMLEYSGPKLYKQPATKSNRGIILNAVEYCVFPGVVNRDAKQKVLDKIARSDAKHFLVLFRDAGCQFRALYSYFPETEAVVKLYGTGPSQVDEYMFDKFFKYNSGGKCFSQVHTKHLTVTIDAFTIHNSLWQGKKVNLPSKKDMTLVI